MTKEQEEGLLTLLERAVVIAEQWYAKCYPIEPPVEEAIIHDPRAERKDPESLEEYRSLPDDGPGRYQQIIAAAKR